MTKASYGCALKHVRACVIDFDFVVFVFGRRGLPIATETGSGASLVPGARAGGLDSATTRLPSSITCSRLAAGTLRCPVAWAFYILLLVFSVLLAGPLTICSPLIRPLTMTTVAAKDIYVTWNDGDLAHWPDCVRQGQAAVREDGTSQEMSPWT